VLFLRKGPGATNHFEGGGFARSNEEWTTQPDVPLLAHRNSIRRFGPAAGTATSHIGPMYSTHVARSRSRHSTDVIHSCVLTISRLIRIARVVKHSRRATDPGAIVFDQFQRRRDFTRTDVSSDQESWTGRARRGNRAAPVVHGQMGVDDMSVVDPGSSWSRHRGCGCGRIGHAYVTNATFFAPVMMVAEKPLTDLGNTPLAPRPLASTSPAGCVQD